jgi:hypothetical protein
MSVAHGMVAGWGQAALWPLQLLAKVNTELSTLQEAVEQDVPALPAECWQTTLEPSHWSTVQTLPSSRQAAPLAFLPSAGQLADVPLQTSATSHSPAAGRQVVPALPAAC